MNVEWIFSIFVKGLESCWCKRLDSNSESLNLLPALDCLLGFACDPLLAPGLHSVLIPAPLPALIRQLAVVMTEC